MSKTKTDNSTLLAYRDRVKLVQSRLNGIRYPNVTRLQKPARVLAAEKIVEAWQEKETAHMDAQREAHRVKLSEVQDALIVGDMAKGVALLQKCGA